MGCCQNQRSSSPLCRCQLHSHLPLKMAGEERTISPESTSKPRHRRKRTKNSQAGNAKNGTVDCDDGDHGKAQNTVGHTPQTHNVTQRGDSTVGPSTMDLSPSDKPVKRKHKSVSTRIITAHVLPSQYSQPTSMLSQEEDGTIFKVLWWLSFLFLTGLAFTTRFHKINEPAHIW